MPPRTVTRLLPLAVVSAVAVTAVTVLVWGGATGGAFAPPPDGLRDAGPLARYGAPILRAVIDVAAAVTVGLLLLAGTVIPEDSGTDRRGAARRLAVVTGTLWVLVSLPAMILDASLLAAMPPTDPAFVGMVLRSAWSIDLLRVSLISMTLAAVATVGAAVAVTRVATTWMAAVAVLAVLPWALTGHAAGSAGHDTAVNSLAVHLVGALVWVGGLGALTLLRPHLGGALSVCVARYSTLAGWCFVAVATSGVLNAWVRVGSWGGLGTAYGMLVVPKVAILVGAGAIGWWIRRGLLRRLTADPDARAAFGMITALELLLMGAAFGLGVALARSAPPVPDVEAVDDPAIWLTGYPAPSGPPQGWDWLTVFRPDWLWLAVAALAIGLYAAAAVRLTRRGDRWPRHRTLTWTAGWLLFVWATSGAPGVYGRLMFSAHMLMHMTLTMGVPLLLCLGAPLTLASRALRPRKDGTLGPRELMLQSAHSRYLSFWAHPVVAALNFFGSLILFYFSGLFEMALRTHTGHILMVIHFMAAGYMFVWVLVGVDPGPRRWPPSLRLLLLFATMSSHAFFGVALMNGRSLLGGDYFRELRLPWMPDLLKDQVEGGALTWGIGELPVLVLALLVGVLWMRDEEHIARRTDRQADRDGDASLAAYNAWLATLGRGGARTDRDTAQAPQPVRRSTTGETPTGDER